MEDTAPEHPLHVERRARRVRHHRGHRAPASATRGWCWRPRASPCSPCSSTRPSCSSRSRRSRDFSVGRPSTLSWVLNAYTIVFAALLIPAGRLADRIGRRRTFLGGVVVFTVGSMLCGLAPTVGAADRRRMLAGGRRGRLVPASLALVLQTFPARRCPSPSPSGAPSAPSPVPPARRSARSSSSNLGWRWAFFINLPVGIVSFFLGRGVLPEGGRRNPGRLPDPVGVVAARRRPRARRLRDRADRASGAGPAAASSVTLAAAAVLIAAVRLALRARAQPAARPRRCSAASNFRWANAAMLVFADRVQRDVPRQRAVPHPGVGLHDPARRHGDRRRPADRRRARRRSSASSPAASASAGC